MNLSDQFEYSLVIYAPWRWSSSHPVVVATPTHFKRFAHPRGVRFSTANIVRCFFINWNIGCRRGTGALGEDAHRAPGAAFFRMRGAAPSRSISASRNCFFNLATSACSGLKAGLPCPEKLPSFRCLYWGGPPPRFQRLSRLARRDAGRIPNSLAASPVGLPERHSSTAMILKARSKCLFSCFMSAKLRIIRLNLLSNQI